MLSIDSIDRGVVLDHIQAGKAMQIYHYLGLDKLDSSVAIIKNVKSNRMGKKDIIKIEDAMDTGLDVIGFIDPNITVNYIDDGRIIRKTNITMPERIENVAKCRNPRCITSTEQGLKHVFVLTDRERGVYRCLYCEHAFEPR